ncbi:glutamine synthetase family protein [Magnetovibrio blakemorei]|uniref:Glutamine synthetase n=1 Tax=Magnetovibrio blakemorei TaxID=28181 RepID=A0A1E5Q627_9PROT|nr:glutamine synthetase family protein [Magnetovibrio blakemorei]OEJ66187.1 glutamine synthetase [Magnetovibrio blakemorei]
MTHSDKIIDIDAWCIEHRITEVECLIPDISGIPRGKILPSEKFLKGIQTDTHRMPESMFTQTVTGDFPETFDLVSVVDKDVVMRPDPSTIRPVPWYTEPTAQVICDCVYTDGTPVDISSRQVLREVLALYEDKGWKPVIAPEVEMYLVKKNIDPDYPLEPPIGRSGRPETGRQAFGIDAANEFDEVFEDVYDYCEAERIDIDTLNHEGGAAQMEVNFLHGDSLDLADQVFLFKRTLRQTAINHGVYATFMAKPMQREAGSALHIHQSLYDLETGKNVFSDDGDGDTPLFMSCVAGMQTYAPVMMPLFAPNVNSYRRFAYEEAPINTHWGLDNRSCGLRIPRSDPASRRVENRLPGADVNPYLAIAATLACGYLGMIENLTPTAPELGNAYILPKNLPTHLSDALKRFEQNASVRKILGDRFVDLFCIVKREELVTYDQVISSWEREHLLLNV